MPCEQPLPGVRRSGLPALRGFLSPAPLLAAVLLGVNDRWLKPAFHNALTGKLSDLAGCFFLPLYLSALLGLATRLPLAARLRAGGLATLALFAPLKLWPGMARQAEVVLTALGQLAGCRPRTSLSTRLIWWPCRSSRWPTPTGCARGEVTPL